MTTTKALILIAALWAFAALIVCVFWHQHRSIVSEQENRRPFVGNEQRNEGDPLRTARWTDDDTVSFWQEAGQ